MGRGRKPLSYEYVKEFIESKGCQLISKTYEGNKKPLKIKCKCGEIFEKTFNVFKDKNQHQCKICSGGHNTDKLSYEEVKSYIESKGCQLISETYEGNRKPLKIKCKCGEIFEKTFNVFKDQNQIQCLKCSGGHNTDKFSYDEVKSYIESKGCGLLSETYENATSKLKIRCKCGEIFEKSFTHFKNDNQNKCMECSGGHSTSYNPNLSEEERIKRRSIEGYSTFNTTLKNTFDKCICCGSTENLCTHHIYDYSNYEEYRTNPLNGIVLCSKCHKEYHSLYGTKKENTYEQFREFCFNKYKETNDIKWLVALETVDCRIYKLSPCKSV